MRIEITSIFENGYQYIMNVYVDNALVMMDIGKAYYIKEI